MLDRMNVNMSLVVRAPHARMKLDPADSASPAFFAAYRFFSAATILALPAALSLRFCFLITLGAADSPFDAAHRFRCASAIALRPAALIPRFLRTAGFVAGAESLGDSMARSSAI